MVVVRIDIKSRLSDIDMSDQRKSSLIGFHAFTGCDYNSSLFRRGKDKCWKVMTKFSKFEKVFAKLGTMSMLPLDDFCVLEEFVCNLYGFKEKDINTFGIKHS